MKIHLAISPEPVPSGFDLVGLCGRIVPKAEFVSLPEEAEQPNSLSGICPKCKGLADSKELHYGAGIISGEESKQLNLAKERRGI